MSCIINRRSFVKATLALGAATSFASAATPALLKPLARIKPSTDSPAGEVVTYSAGNGGPLKLIVKDGVLRNIETFSPEVRASQRERANRKALYSPARVLYPLKRADFVPGGTGSTEGRGKGQFVRITWNEALDIVASELQRIKSTYGNAAIYGAADWASIFPSFHHVYNMLYRFLNLFGGRTEYRTFYSNAAISTAWPYSLGSDFSTNDPQDILNNSKLILFLWTDPAHTSTHRNDNHNNLWLKQCKEKGIKMIHVNPRFTDSMAAYGDKWIPITPGTDCALMAAMAYVMISENLYDKNFIDTYTIGFDKFKDYVMGVEDGIPKTPEWAEAICGVEANTIKALARDVATIKPAVIWQGWGAQRGAYGEQPVRMAITLAAMTGNIGIPGGCLTQGPNNSNSLRNVAKMVGGIPVPPNPVNSFFPIALFPDALLHPGEPFKWNRGNYNFPNIKAIYYAGFNQFNQQGNLNKTIEAMKKPEFIVVNEPYLTPTAKFADIVLPAVHQFERNDFLGFYKYLIFMKKAVEPLGEAKSDYDIFTMLAEKLGFKEEFTQGRTEMQWLEYLYSQSDCPLSFADMQQQGYYVFNKPTTTVIGFANFRNDPTGKPLDTPSGKIEIYSDRLAALNDPQVPGVPKFVEPWESRRSPKASQYPLELITPHPRYRLHSQFDHVSWIQERIKVDGYARLWINPMDAGPRGISKGDVVRVYNDRGETLAKAAVSSTARPGVVILEEGAWYNPAEPGVAHTVDRGGNPNVVNHDVGTSQLAQGPTTHTTLVQVTKKEA